MSAHILIVEDDDVVNELISENLQARGYQITACRDGKSAIELALVGHFDLIVLDIMLPHLSGLEVLKRLRQNKDTPVLMLTALGNEQERIEGLKTGADDYLSKPFNITELILRIDAVLRRFHYNANQLDNKSKHFQLIADRVPDLTSSELDIIKYLLNNITKPLTKAYLYQVVLNKEFGRYDRTLDMHISNIRKKFKAAGVAENVIKTVRGKGYMLSQMPEFTKPLKAADDGRAQSEI